MGRYQRAVELAAITEPGLRVADLGCGTGRLVDQLVHHQYPPARVDAIDHASDLDDHVLTDHRVRSAIADLDEAIPVADQVLDRAFSINVLENLVDPVRHLRDIYRVLKPGGVAVVVHSDWDTLMFSTGVSRAGMSSAGTASALGADALTRRLVDRFVAAMPGWVSRADGFMGRRLPGLASQARAAGADFEVVGVHTWADPHRRFDEDSLAHKVAIGMAMAGAADDELAPFIAAWLDSVEAASAAGDFVFCVTDVAVVLRRP